jgi:type I restriction enzyme S subunit
MAVTKVRLRDLGEWAGGNTPSRANATYWTDGTVPWVSPKDMKADEIRTSKDRITEAALIEGRVSLVPQGSVLFVTRSGILAHTLPVAVTKLPVTINQDLKALKPRAGVSPKYVAHAVRGASRQILKECSKHGTTVASIETHALLDFEIPLVDLDEQHRIVAEIEKQFSRIDEAVGTLKRVKANLKRYEASILKAAVKGRLVPTEAELARRERREYEPGIQLLRRVLEVRRNQSNSKTKYQESLEPATSTLPALPEGWAWARLDALASIKGGITVDKKRQDPTARAVPYLRVANVQRGFLDLSEIKFIEAPAADIEDLRLMPGDILLNEGGDRDKLGRGWIWEGQLPECIHQNHVFRARPAIAEMSGKWISWWGNTFGRDYFLREGKQTTNLASINISKLAALPVPIPPAAEQRRLVAEIDMHLSFIREIADQIDHNLQRAARMRTSVLCSQFAIRSGAHS